MLLIQKRKNMKHLNFKKQQQELDKEIQKNLKIILIILVKKNKYDLFK